MDKVPYIHELIRRLTFDVLLITFAGDHIEAAAIDITGDLKHKSVVGHDGWFRTLLL